MTDSIPAAASRAVFLSCASQDAAAARHICDALRGAGVEVWFDVEGGLEHGDEWDAKIRRQIKECVLFIPIISAITQAREEGYFRLSPSCVPPSISCRPPNAATTGRFTFRCGAEFWSVIRDGFWPPARWAPTSIWWTISSSVRRRG
jgi:hypothetical protein